MAALRRGIIQGVLPVESLAASPVVSWATISRSPRAVA
jgi:hypothetical protein